MHVKNTDPAIYKVQYISYADVMFSLIKTH